MLSEKTAPTEKKFPEWNPRAIAEKAFFWFGEKNCLNYLVYAILSLLIWLPLLVKPGYVFAPDMVFTPKLRFPSEISSFYLIDAFFFFVSFLISSPMLQKTLLFLSLWLAGVGMHRLAPTKSQWPRYFAGFLYIFNPFVFSRFMYGQLLLVLAYALMPFAIKAIMDFFRDVSLKKTLRVGGWLVLLGVIDIRFVFFSGLFFGIAFLFFALRSVRNPKLVGRLLLYALLVGAIFFIFNFYWLVPGLLGKGSAAQLIAQFDWQQEWAFRTTADEHWGLFFNAGAMYGFWGDAQKRYLGNKEFAPYWPYLFMVLLGLVFWGVISAFLAYLKKRKDNLKLKIENSQLSDDLNNPNNPNNLNIPPLADRSIAQSLDRLLPVPVFVLVGLISYVLAIGVGAYCDPAANCQEVCRASVDAANLAKCESVCCSSLALPSWLLPFRAEAGKMSYRLVNFLNEHVPFYRGFREPQKFTGLLILCYCYLGALGVDNILRKLQAKSYKLKAKKTSLSAFRALLCTKLVPVFFLILPILYAPGLLWGFRGQLFSSSYPSSWFAANEILNQDGDLAGHRTFGGYSAGAKVLFLPWHQYLALNFVHNENFDYKVVANPAPNFFDKEVIAGDNMEMPGLLNTSARPFTLFFENEFLPRADQMENMGELLAPWDVKYVLWAGEGNFTDYLFVLRQQDLKLVYSSPYDDPRKDSVLMLFENAKWQKIPTAPR